MYRVKQYVRVINGKFVYYMIEKRKKFLFLIPYWSKKIFNNKGTSRFCFTITIKEAEELIKILKNNNDFKRGR